MAKTLTLDFDMQNEVGISMKGISFKALSSCDSFKQNLIRNDLLKYAIDCNHTSDFDPTTCHIKEDRLIIYLKDLYEALPFDKIKIEGYYHLTGEQLMNKILTNE